MKKIVFLDRDGTLIVEPADHQIDSVAKFQLLPEVIPSLLKLRDAGFVEVMVDGQRRLYRLKPDPLQEIDDWLEPFSPIGWICWPAWAGWISSRN